MDHNWTHCFRMRPYFRNLGLTCAAASFAFGLWATFAAYFNIDGSFRDPNRSALLFCVTSSAFTCLGCWLVLLYYKYRLFINNETLRQIGVFSDYQINLNLVDELKWQRLPAGGRVRISGMFGVFQIELGNFNDAEREELICFLRQAILETRQLGWEQFNEQLADTPEQRQRSRHSQVVEILLFIAVAIIFGTVSVVIRDVRYLIVSGVNVVAATYLFRKHLREKSVPKS